MVATNGFSEDFDKSSYMLLNSTFFEVVADDDIILIMLCSCSP